jgi:hypothetical protein
MADFWKEGKRTFGGVKGEGLPGTTDSQFPFSLPFTQKACYPNLRDSHSKMRNPSSLFALYRRLFSNCGTVSTAGGDGVGARSMRDIFQRIFNSGHQDGKEKILSGVGSGYVIL